MGLLDGWETDDELKALIKEKIRYDRSFLITLTRDLTKQIRHNLHWRMFGSRTNHFVLYVSGVPGISTTGVGKTSIGLELAQLYDKNFNIHKVAFTNEELLDKMQEFAHVGKLGQEIPQVFLRDEGTRTLKQRATVEFSVISETLRDSRISLILIKPNMEDNSLAHYHLQPFLMKKDLSKIRAAVWNFGSQRYRGYIDIDIQVNSPIWLQYMHLKKQFQEDVVERKVGVFDPEKHAQKILEKYDTDDYIQTTKKGTPKLIQTRLKRYILDECYSLTNEEREFVLDSIKKKLQDDGRL